MEKPVYEKAQVEMGIGGTGSRLIKQYRCVIRRWTGRNHLGEIVEAGSWRNGQQGYDFAQREVEQWTRTHEQEDSTSE